MAAVLDAILRLNSSQFAGGLDKAVRESNSAVTKMSAQFNTLRNVMGAGLAGHFGVAMVGSILSASMEMEKLETAMSATFGSQAIGAVQLEKVKKLAGEIGLGVNEAARAMIKFKSAGMGAEDSLKAIKAGYNAVVSAGGGTEEFSRFAVAIQQLQASPKVLQEELNQLREALPTTAKLMKDAFGVTRAEDIQKLNISGAEFAATMLKMMEALPQLGNTMEKEVNRMKAKWLEFKAEIGGGLAPIASKAMTVGTRALSMLSALRKFQIDNIAGIFDPKAMQSLMSRTDEEDAAKGIVMITDARAKAVALKEKELSQNEKDAAYKKKDIENAEKMIGILGKFNDIIKKGRAEWRALISESNFANGTDAFDAQERGTSLEKGISAEEKKTREQMEVNAAAKAATERGKFDALAQAEERTKGDKEEQWREKIERAGMTRSERKAERQSEKELRKNTEKAINREAREMLEKERADNRLRAFDNLKNNLGFMDEEGSKKRLKDQARKEQEDVGKKSIMTLGEIRDILKTLATA